MPLEGYAKIAAVMSERTEFAILRRFSRLNMQNILYLQAELLDLEAQLGELAKEDFEIPERMQFVSRWDHLAKSNGQGEDGKQWRLMLTIREKLNEYSMYRLLYRL